MTQKDTIQASAITANAAPITANTNTTTTTTAGAGARPMKRRVISIEYDRYYNNHASSTTAQSGSSSGYNSSIENEIIMSKKMEDPYLFLLKQSQRQQKQQRKKRIKSGCFGFVDDDKKETLDVEKTFHGGKPLRESRVNAIQRGIIASQALFEEIYKDEDDDDDDDDEYVENTSKDTGCAIGNSSGVFCEELVLGIPGMNKPQVKDWMEIYDREFNNTNNNKIRMKNGNHKTPRKSLGGNYKNNLLFNDMNGGADGFNGYGKIEEAMRKMFNRSGTVKSGELSRSEIAYFAGLQRELDQMLVDIRRQEEDEEMRNNAVGDNVWEEALMGKMRFK